MYVCVCLFSGVKFILSLTGRGTKLRPEGPFLGRCSETPFTPVWESAVNLVHVIRHSVVTVEVSSCTKFHIFRASGKG